MHYLIRPGISNGSQISPCVLTDPWKGILPGGENIGIIYKGISISVRCGPATPVVTTCWSWQAENISGAGVNVSMCLVIYEVVVINFVVNAIIVKIDSIVVVRSGVACQCIIVAIVVEVDTGVVARGDVIYQGVTAGIVQVNTIAVIPTGCVVLQEVVSAIIVQVDSVVTV